jgi:hypothetical protein
MDAYGALGLAANIFQFIQYGLTIVREAKRLKATQGTPNAALAQSTCQLEAIVRTIKHQIPTRNATVEQQMLTDLSGECLAISNKLLALLESLKAENPNSLCDHIRSIIKNKNRAKEKGDLEENLERCKSQLLLQLSNLAR